jgi:hypothetical protein
MLLSLLLCSSVDILPLWCSSSLAVLCCYYLSLADALPSSCYSLDAVPLFHAWLLSLDIFDDGASSLADSDLRVFHALLCLWIFLIVITM